MSQKIWREEEPEELINVFLKMWDGKVRSWQRGISDRRRGPSVDDSSLCSSHVVLLVSQTLCCLINPRQAAITSIGILEQKVVESYPDQSREDFFLETQSKPLNEYSFNSLTWNEGATVFVQYRKRGGCFIFSFSILCIIFMAIVGSFFTCGCSLLIIPILLPFLFILPFFCL